MRELSRQRRVKVLLGCVLCSCRSLFCPLTVDQLVVPLVHTGAPAGVRPRRVQPHASPRAAAATRRPGRRRGGRRGVGRLRPRAGGGERFGRLLRQGTHAGGSFTHAVAVELLPWLYLQHTLFEVEVPCRARCWTRKKTFKKSSRF
jgi:hypothetical protein